MQRQTVPEVGANPVYLVPHPQLLDTELREVSRDHSVAALGGTDVVLIPANPRRTAVFITNNSANNVYIGLGYQATTTTGIRLNSGGGALELNKTNLFRGVIHAIAGGAGSNVTAVEIESRYAD